MLDEGRYCGSPELFVINAVADPMIYGCCRLSHQTIDYYSLQVYDGCVGWYVGTSVSEKPLASATMVKQQK
jgi:hypothetical protein